MRLLLDTTYLLPAIGVSLEGLPHDAPFKLLEKGYNLSISNITLFELEAKGAKYIAQGDLTVERVSRGIRAIVYDDRLERIPTYETPILLTSFTLRRLMNDFIDCLILSSAINHGGMLVTEDKRIHELEERTVFQEIIKATNPQFKVNKLDDVA